jgi:hypothetical protein
MQTRSALGSAFLIAAVAWAATQVGAELGAADTWSALAQPKFAGKMLEHIGAMGLAWVSGQQFPSVGALLPKSDRK